LICFDELADLFYGLFCAASPQRHRDALESCVFKLQNDAR